MGAPGAAKTTFLKSVRYFTGPLVLLAVAAILWLVGARVHWSDAPDILNVPISLHRATAQYSFRARYGGYRFVGLEMDEFIKGRTTACVADTDDLTNPTAKSACRDGRPPLVWDLHLVGNPKNPRPYPDPRGNNGILWSDRPFYTFGVVYLEPKGKYQLTIDSLSDASYLDIARPRILIFPQDNGEEGAMIMQVVEQLAAILFASAGLGWAAAASIIYVLRIRAMRRG